MSSPAAPASPFPPDELLPYPSRLLSSQPLLSSRSLTPSAAPRPSPSAAHRFLSFLSLSAACGRTAIELSAPSQIQTITHHKYCTSSYIMYRKSSQSTRLLPPLRSVESMPHSSSQESYTPVMFETRLRSSSEMYPLPCWSQSEQSHSLTPPSPTLALQNISTKRLQSISLPHLSISSLMIRLSYRQAVTIVAFLSTLFVITPLPSLSSCSKVDCRQETGAWIMDSDDSSCTAEAWSSEWCSSWKRSMDSSRKVSATDYSSVQWSKSQEDYVYDITIICEKDGLWIYGIRREGNDKGGMGCFDKQRSATNEL